VRVLDLFCGAGGASMGYKLAGFDVVGVDYYPQRHYPFPFAIVNAMDVLANWAPGPTGAVWPSDEALIGTDDGQEWCLEDFDLIHASPPCQPFTRAKHLRNAQGGKSKAEDLLTPALPLLKAVGLPYVVENVPGAPMRPDIVLCGSMFGLKVQRHRWFQSNLPLRTPGPCRHKEQGKPIGIYHQMGDTAQGRDKKTGRWVIGGSTAKNIEEAQEAMGIDWMTWPEIKEAIPPAYTRWIGHEVTRILGGAER
jgi:DNA (cytosine-5)-methyltransferase 1